ncbi:MAG TPA: ATP-binding protein [Kiritimatiellia bacterium]|nr:ATP-binding protein [Kiritimatiellia bacterium]
MSARNREEQAADSTVHERIKELECLYAIVEIASKTAATLQEVLQRIADMLPAAWRLPEHARSRIVLDGLEMHGGGRRLTGGGRQEAAIVVRGVSRGAVAVGYPQARLRRSGNAFLDEEQRLLNEVARQIARIVERKEDQQAHEALQEQLRHADRLATVGQLASGVAHELNDPLGSILGFTQLIEKTPRMPRAALADIAKVKAAALHARDIIRKLMVFARQTPPQYSSVDLNSVVEKSAGLWTWRCEDAGVRVVYELDAKLPSIVADERQILQLTTNLAVNAMQAMTEGGYLTLATSHGKEWVELSVSDTGAGIPPDILPRVFDPFFTTKDIDQGTGLGLSVVHGIVTGHGGNIRVDSKVGRGTRMHVRLPIRPPTTKSAEGEG